MYHYNRKSIGNSFDRSSLIRLKKKLHNGRILCNEILETEYIYVIIIKNEAKVVISQTIIKINVKSVIKNKIWIFKNWILKNKKINKKPEDFQQRKN